MKLYWGKHTCAIGVHVLLEEAGAPYELEELDIAGGEQTRAPFRGINPKGKVPTVVRDDGSVLTEYGAIAGWIAETFKPDLLPDDLEARTRMREAMDYVVGTIHGQAYHRLFMPTQYAAGDDREEVLAGVKAEGRRMAEEGFGIVGECLGAGPWLAGERFTIGDTALFYAARWADQTKVELPAPVADHLRRMKARPAVAEVMRAWGEA